MEQKMKMLENLQDDFDFNYKTLKSQGGIFLKITVCTPSYNWGFSCLFSQWIETRWIGVKTHLQSFKYLWLDPQNKRQLFW